MSFNIPPESAKRPHLKAGQYGPGCQFEADAIIRTFEAPSEKMPAYDKLGEKGPYVHLVVQVNSRDFGTCFVDEFFSVAENAGSPIFGWLQNLGLITPDGDVEPEHVEGTKVIVEVGEPRQWQDNFYTGRCKGLFPAS